MPESAADVQQTGGLRRQVCRSRTRSLEFNSVVLAVNTKLDELVASVAPPSSLPPV